MDTFEVALISNSKNKLLETNEVLMDMGVVPYLFLINAGQENETKHEPNIIEIDDLAYIND